MLHTRTLRALATASLLTACGLVHAADAVIASPYTALAVFGDSLSDSGNNKLVLAPAVGPIPTSNTYIPSGLPPYASGTYSNGPVWVSAFASNLGLPSYGLPSLAGGADYAAGGAVTAGTFVYPPSATQQVGSFLASVSGSLPATGLYVIAIGANDVRDVGAALANGASPSTVPVAAAAYATSVGAMVDSLQARGAQHIIVWNVPDIGKTPALLTSPAAAVVATSVSAAFNQALAGRLAGEAGVSIFDTFSFVDAMAANPAAFGLSNVTDACGALVNACSSSLSTALFYDGIHPTAAGHAIIAQLMTSAALAAAVPEPGSWLLMALGLVLVSTRRGQRARAAA